MLDNCVDVAWYRIGEGEFQLARVAFCPAFDMPDLLAAIDESGCLVVLRFSAKWEKITNLYSAKIEENVMSIAWSPDGSLLALGGKRTFLHMIDTKSWKEATKPMCLAGRIWRIQFVPKGYDEQFSTPHNL
jgi:Anaphase-promoting complex subunit 4 WD40 domain